MLGVVMDTCDPSPVKQEAGDSRRVQVVQSESRPVWVPPDPVSKSATETKTRADKTAQQTKTLATKPEDLSLIRTT